MTTYVIGNFSSLSDIKSVSVLFCLVFDFDQ